MTAEDVIARRLAEARKELDRIRDYEYALVNDVLDIAVAELRAIVLTERGVGDGVTALAESCRTQAGSPRLLNALASFGKPSPDRSSRTVVESSLTKHLRGTHYVHSERSVEQVQPGEGRGTSRASTAVRCTAPVRLQIHEGMPRRPG